MTFGIQLVQEECDCETDDTVVAMWALAGVMVAVEHNMAQVRYSRMACPQTKLDNSHSGWMRAWPQSGPGQGSAGDVYGDGGEPASRSSSLRDHGYDPEHDKPATFPLRVLERGCAQAQTPYGF